MSNKKLSRIVKSFENQRGGKIWSFMILQESGSNRTTMTILSQSGGGGQAGKWQKNILTLLDCVKRT